MNQPLDFSGGARKTAPTPPSKKVPRSSRPTGGATRKRALVTLLLILIAGVAIVAWVARSRDARTPTSSGTATTLDAGRFCQLGGQLDQTAMSTGAASAPGVYDGPREKISAAVTQMGGRLEELKSAAPGPARPDVGAVVDALRRAAAGDPSSIMTPGFTAIAKRVTAYSSQYCTTGSGNGEG